MGTKECTKCSRKGPAKASFCSSCGGALAVPMAKQPQGPRSKGKQFLLITMAIGLGVVIGSVVKLQHIDKIPEQYSSIIAQVSSYLANDAPNRPSSEEVQYVTDSMPITGKEELYTYMREKEAAINRSTPILVNRLLKLTRVHFRLSTRTMTYHYEVIPRDYDIEDVPDVMRNLQARYCTEDEYADLRGNNAPARFIYWKRGARVLEMTARGCDAQQAAR